MWIPLHVCGGAGEGKGFPRGSEKESVRAAREMFHVRLLSNSPASMRDHARMDENNQQSSSHSLPLVALLTGLPFRTASKIYQMANSMVCSYPVKEMERKGEGSLLCSCPTCTLTTCQRVLWLVVWLNFCPVLHRVLRANCVLNL